MVKIRLQRAGKKKAPFYHIVVADSKSPRDGKIIEQIYDGALTKVILKTSKNTVKALIAGNDKLYNRGDVIYLYWTIEDAIILGSERNGKK